MAIHLRSDVVIDSLIPKLAARVQTLRAKGFLPTMHVFLIGENEASKVYVRNKKKMCEKVGANCIINHLAHDISEKEVLGKIESSIKDPNVHGIFVQLPVPKQLEYLPFETLIPPSKDVDGFHPQNIFGIFNGSKSNTYLQPCTPKGMMTLLAHYNIPLAGKNIVVIGRSKIVGKPFGLMALNEDATVTFAHSKTKNLPEITKKADIVIAAVGRANFFGKEFFRNDKSQIVIDVGINKNSDGKLCGDINFHEVEAVVNSITPVPGGVGPMTVATLIQNLIQATEFQNL